MSGPPQSTMARLRDRDGDDCWLCGTKMDFAAPANSKKAPTREHLVPVSQGGTGAIDNLVLCHPGCNRHLGDRPKADKVRIREKAIANRAKQMAGTHAAKQKVPPSAGLSPKQPTLTFPQTGRAKARPTAQDARSIAQEQWMRLAIVTSGLVLFLAGLVVGLLVR